VLNDATVWGGPITKIFCEEAERLGSKPALVWSFGEGEKQHNFDPLVQAVLKTEPDLVYFAVYWNPAHIIAHELRYQRCKAVFLGTDALKSYPYLEVPGLDVTSPYHTYPGADIRLDPRCREFFPQFVTRYPHTLVNLQYAPEGYDCVGLLAEALRRAGNPDRAQVLHELQHIGKYEGLSGTLSFDEHGDLLEPEIGLYQCIDGLRKYLGSLRDLLK
jgi:branched-chain amino acid transport system substrate-binding protein